MVIGITGPLGCGKDSVIKLIKKRANEKYMYLNTDEIIISLLKPGTTCYNYVCEVLGEERLNKYKNPQSLRYIYTHNLMLYNPKDYLDFMNAVQPFVSCRIAKLTVNFPNKLIFIVSNNLYDYDWAEKCDRIIYINTPAKTRRYRLMKKNFYGTNHYKAIEELFISEEEQINKADIIINSTDKITLKKEIKKMLKDLLKFKKFTDSGMIPLPTIEIREKDANRLKEVKELKENKEEK